MSDGYIVEAGVKRCNACTHLRRPEQFYCARTEGQRKVLGTGQRSIIRLIGSTDRTPSWCPFDQEAAS